MADSLREAASSLQPPATQSSSLTTGDDVLDGSQRSSTSRDRPSQGSSTAGSFLTLSPSASSSHDVPPEPASTATSTHLQLNTQASPDGPSPPQLPQRFGQSPNNAYLSNASSSLSRQNYDLSPSASNSNSISPPTPPANTSNARASRTASHRTSHRHNRSSGAFLLSDSLGSAGHASSSHGKSTHARSSQRESTSGSHKNRSNVGRAAGSRLSAAPETPEKGAALSSPAGNNTPDSTHSSGSSRRSHGSSSASGTARAQTPESGAASPAATAHPAAPALPTGQPLDLDSAQIVNMALNLSESRRLAARRNVSVSQQLPPRLAPLPDSAVGGSLLRQLQQQRRISRTMSPKPDRGGAGGRVSSSGQFPPGQSPRMSTSSALQPPFELLPDGTAAGQGQYRYHFSQSTLARAQKAKDYLELLAQHRRLLELIPPLTPAAAARSRATSIGSPPTTSNNAGQPQSLFLTGTNSNGDLVLGSTRLGRPYNPLQYIRNRKVRVRERRAIDGQAQGFGDVAKATDWVDGVAKWTATGQGRMLGGYTLPAFSTADADTALQSSPPPASRAAGQAVLAKPKRPRIDWVIDPADMIADVYWLEQGDNKKLVEDHHWRRVFPQDSSLYQPISQRVDDSMAGVKAGEQADGIGNIPALAADGDTSTTNSRPLYAMPVGAHLKPVENSPEPDHGSARKRARQKLSELRSFHHRHNSSVHSQDVQRLRRGSFSDTSDSDNDRRRFGRARADSGTANGAEVLNKNMMGKIARENRERDENAAAAASVSASAAAAAATSTTASKEQKRTATLQASSTGVTPLNGKQARPESTKAAKHPVTAAAIDSPSKQGRASLEIPTVGRRLSLDYDSSRPTSPELHPFSKDGLGFVPPLGGDLSPPPSRAQSPPRHRFGKVKSIFRDHSRERDHRDRDRDRDRANNTILDRGEDYIEPSARSSATVQQHQHQAHQAQQQQHQDYVESTSAPLTAVSTVADDLRFASSNEAKGPHSPIRKIGTRPSPGTFDTHRSHTSISSITGHLHSTNTNPNSHHHNHNRSEEGGSSGGTLRGFFKGGPRIDTMLRSGVSKVSDMLWRREGSEPLFGDASAAAAAGAHMSQQSSSDDDSESEAAPRDRFRNSTLPSRSPSVNPGPEVADKSPYSTIKPSEKHYLDVMPTFGRGGGEDPITRPPSRQSARFERLKPPRIDVRDASPSADDAANSLKQLGESSSSNANRRNSSLQPIGRQPHRGSQDSDYSESDTRSRRSSRVSGVASSIAGSLADGTGTLQPLPRKFSSTSAMSGVKGERPRWSLSQPAYNHHHGSLSRRELARLRASMYSSAVLAKELSRRANEPKILVRSWDSAKRNSKAKANDNGNGNGSARRRSSTALDAAVADKGADADDDNDHQNDDDAEVAVPNASDSGPIIVRGSNGEQSLTWADIAAYGPNPTELARRPVKQVEIYPLAAQVLGSAIQRSGHSWQISAEMFANTTVPQLRQRIEGVRTRVSVELSGLARQAADEADEVTRDLMAVQRLQVKRVEDSIEKMLRRRRRRFRWVRRAGWLTVEWLLVGFMWYVWFVVMLARIILGFGRGIYSGVRWLLWL
ncbi:hypothetical protein Sste5346_008636 [Sporothrix stenoceras]|uniref:Uncharacterized protein n=1 Tax=Sporothrix stenoceras TaxID=5173 RepID=A0ABR3YRA9_9PEZI